MKHFLIQYYEFFYNNFSIIVQAMNIFFIGIALLVAVWTLYANYQLAHREDEFDKISLLWACILLFGTILFNLPWIDNLWVNSILIILVGIPIIAFILFLKSYFSEKKRDSIYKKQIKYMNFWLLIAYTWRLLVDFLFSLIHWIKPLGCESTEQYGRYVDLFVSTLSIHLIIISFVIGTLVILSSKLWRWYRKAALIVFIIAMIYRLTINLIVCV